MRVAIIGGTGHIGTYLVPRLLEAGHEVTNVTRGQREPYQPRGIWKAGPPGHRGPIGGGCRGDLRKTDRGARRRGGHRLDLFTRPARRACARAGGQGRPVPFCGTIWVHGPSGPSRSPRRCRVVPSGTTAIARPRSKRSCWIGRTRRVSRRWSSIPGISSAWGGSPEPAGNFNPAVFQTIARERTSACPTWGWRRCTTCTRMTWPRSSSGPWSGGAHPSERASTWSLLRPSACAGTPNGCSAGSDGSPGWPSRLGRPGRGVWRRATPRRPWTTSPTVPTAPSRKRRRSWDTGRATPPWRPFGRPSTGSWSTNGSGFDGGRRGPRSGRRQPSRGPGLPSNKCSMTYSGASGALSTPRLRSSRTTRKTIDKWRMKDYSVDVRYPTG